jgi:hypothetical protein
VQKRAPFPSFKHWFELNKKKYPKGNRGLKIALEVYGVHDMNDTHNGYKNRRLKSENYKRRIDKYY